MMSLQAIAGATPEDERETHQGSLHARESEQPPSHVQARGSSWPLRPGGGPAVHHDRPNSSGWSTLRARQRVGEDDVVPPGVAPALPSLLDLALPRERGSIGPRPATGDAADDAGARGTAL